jgi:hypothetical protein
MNLHIHPTRFVLFSALFVVCWDSTIVEAEPDADAPPATASAPSDAQIAAWVADLDSNQYRVREAATQQLAATAVAALDPLLAAANSKRPEPADRAVWIMQQLARTTDLDQRQQVLEHLARVENRPQVVDEAKAGLAEIEHQLAVHAIEQLGGRYLEEGADPKTGQTMPKRVVLDDRWRGGDAGLKQLIHLHAVPLVTIVGTDVSAKGVAQLAGVESLQLLQLFGTRLEDADVAGLKTQFAQHMPAVKIDYRRGALLGVVGPDIGQSAVVRTVQPGTAAATAGIQDGDTIQKIDGKPIADFAALTTEVGKHRAGDEIVVELQRGGQTLELKVKLGRWESS